MSEKTFMRLLAAIVVLGVAATLIHLAYAVYAYQHCSIIYFIAKELW